jgi:hypothetical protein
VTVRIYLPATLPMLQRWLVVGQAEPGPKAYSVTPTLREWYREADLDELEAAAQVAASIGSLELLAADPSAPRRRVVVAADVAEGEVRPVATAGRAAICLASSVPFGRWASALVDDPDATVVVSAAVASLARAAGGDDEAQFDLDEAEAHELGWYAVQELRFLVGPDRIDL